MDAKVSFETVRKLGLQLPNVEEGTGFGKPALKAGGKMFVCVPSHKSAEPDSLAGPHRFRAAGRTAGRGPGSLLHYGPL
jgi:hypothetical protein